MVYRLFGGYKISFLNDRKRKFSTNKTIQIFHDKHKVEINSYVPSYFPMFLKLIDFKMVYKSKHNLPLSPFTLFSFKSIQGKERYDYFVNRGIKFLCQNELQGTQSSSMGHLNPILNAQ
jgi:hypothetical protein